MNHKSALNAMDLTGPEPKSTGCGEERVFLVPGNHDADQSFVKQEFEFHKESRDNANELAKINEMYSEDVFLKKIATKFAQFNELQECLRNSSLQYKNSFASVYKITQLNIDIVILNTAAFSSAGLRYLGNDERALAVPEYAIRDAVKNLSVGSLRIFTTHHPLAMLSESAEKYLRRVIQAEADVHLFGHMHEPLTIDTTSFEGSLYSNQAGAIFTARQGAYIGYSLIMIDQETKFLETRLRTFFNERSMFDVAIDIHNDGVHYSSQKARTFWRGIAKPVDDEAFREYLSKNYSDAFEYELDESGERNSNFVQPPMVSQKVQSDNIDDSNPTIEIDVAFDDIVKGGKNIILSGLPEHGKTTVLKEVQCQLLKQSTATRVPYLPIFVEFDDIATNVSKLLRTVKSLLLVSDDRFDAKSLLMLGHICLLFDDVDFSDEKRMKILRNFVTQFPKSRYIFSCPKDVMAPSGAHAIPEMPVYFKFIEVCPLKRRQMRELVSKYNFISNIDDILDRVQSEIEQINFPFTTANGSILLSIFEEQSGFRAINRSVLIEQFVDITLRKGDRSQSERLTFDYTNKTALLAHIAKWMTENDNYMAETETIRDVMRKYIDSVGLNVDLTDLLQELLSVRIFVQKSKGRISFRYRAILEYFIALEMFDNHDFKEWVLKEERYLNFINEIHYFAGKLRRNSELINTIEERFDVILAQVEVECGRMDMHTITDIHLPNKQSGPSSVNYLEEQLNCLPLTEEERDKELETEIPRDRENRQEVFRPEIKNDAQRFLVSLLLYSGVLKNMEHISDAEKRRHLGNLWRGWGIFLHLSLQIAGEIAKKRSIRVNGVLYVLSAPHDIPVEELTRIIALSMPQGVSRLIHATLGTEKLEKQLTEPEEIEGPLILKFFRTALVSDLRLTSSVKMLSNTLSSFRSSFYLTEALIWKISDLRRLDKLTPLEFDKLTPKVAEAISCLKGGTKKNQKLEKNRQIDRFKKKSILLRLKKVLEKS